MSNMITATESARLDALTAYNSTVLNGLRGEALDSALTAKRRGRSDSDFRSHVLNGTHPDDLASELVSKGHTLASLGIQSVSL